MDTKKIFIIEDEEKIRNELITFLNKYGYITSYSVDFENIVEDALKSKCNLILLDINLPYYDGYYICREIRKKSDVPIIVVTSRDSEVDELMSMNLGADSKNESRILYVLIKNNGKIVSRNEIIEALWESDEFVDDNTLTVNINRLRKKLEEIGANDFLKTKRGQGYILI